LLCVGCTLQKPLQIDYVEGSFVKLVRILMLMVLAALAGGGLAGCAGDATHRSTAQTVDDGTITAKVKSALLADSRVSGTDVKVETYRGVVQLSGFVDNAGQAQQAVAVAQGVTGVREVKNDIRVKPAEATGGTPAQPSSSGNQ
jgi:hyperosmotically inducible protein